MWVLADYKMGDRKGWRNNSKRWVMPGLAAGLLSKTCLLSNYLRVIFIYSNNLICMCAVSVHIRHPFSIPTFLLHAKDKTPAFKLKSPSSTHSSLCVSHSHTTQEHCLQRQSPPFTFIPSCLESVFLSRSWQSVYWLFTGSFLYYQIQ